MPVLFILLTSNAMAQSIETIVSSRPVTMGGNLSYNHNYEMLPDSSSSYYYLSGSLNTKFFGVVDVPVSFSYTNNKFTKNMAMPFNRFSLSPSYKGYTVYIGYNSMTFSKYTMSGHDYFGGGFGYSGSGPWSTEAFFGRLRKAIMPDSSTNDAGYARIGGGLKVGYMADRYGISVNAIRIHDRDNSVDFTGFEEQYVVPKDNTAASILLNVKPLSSVTIAGEYAISQMTENNKPMPETIQSESTVYHAFDASITYTSAVGSVGVSYDRLPPNYETLGGYYFSEDEEQVAVNLSANISDKASLAGSFGYRHDNLDNQQTVTNKSFAYSLDASATPVERLSLSASVNNDQSYANLRDNIEQLTMMSEFEDLDTNEYSRLNLTASFGANYTTKPSEIISNSFTSSFSYNTTSDEQRYDTTTANSKIYNLNLGSNTSFLIPKISAGINVSMSKTDTESQKYKMLTLTGSLSKSFACGLSLSSAYTYAATKTDTLNSAITNLRATAAYALLKKHNLSLSFCYIHNPMSITMRNRYTLSFTYSYAFTIIGDKKKKEEDNE